MMVAGHRLLPAICFQEPFIVQQLANTLPMSHGLITSHSHLPSLQMLVSFRFESIMLNFQSLYA